MGGYAITLLGQFGVLKDDHRVELPITTGRLVAVVALCGERARATARRADVCCNWKAAPTGNGRPAARRSWGALATRLVRSDPANRSPRDGRRRTGLNNLVPPGHGSSGGTQTRSPSGSSTPMEHRPDAQHPQRTLARSASGQAPALPIVRRGPDPAAATVPAILSPLSGPARVGRATVLGMWVVLGACAGHLASSGQIPPWIALAPVVGVTVAVAWCLAARRLRYGTVLALIALPQVVVHVLAGYVHGHPEVPSPAMLTAHLLATVVTAAVVARVERAWWLVWGWLTRGPRSIGWSAVTPVPAVAVGWIGRRVAHGPMLAHHLVRRGPPLS